MIMNGIRGIFVAGTAFAAAAPVFAQQGPGWNIAWGAQGALAVPLGPWTSALIAVALSAAAYLFLRKGGGGAAAAVLVAALVGGAYFAEDLRANSQPTFVIETSSGSQFVSCVSEVGSTNEPSVGISDMIVVETNVSDGVTIAALEYEPGELIIDILSEQEASESSNSIEVCEVGMVLTPGSQCFLPCER